MATVRRLSELKLSGFSLVPKGASKGAHVRLLKARDADVEKDADGGATITSMPEPDLSIAEKEALAKELATAREQLEAAKAELAKAQTAADEAKDTVPDQVRKELDETREQLELMKAEQRRAEIVKQAAEFGLGDSDELIELLEKADTHFDEAQRDSLHKLLKAAGTQAEQSDLFKRISKDAADEPGDWRERLEKTATELVKSGAEPTIQQARVAAMNADPELRKARAESRVA